jgi:hypothetical protein
LHEDERNERQAFTKQQSGLGDTKLRPEWWKGSKFKKELLELVGFPYLYKGKVCFAKWFELKKYGKHRAKRYQKTVLPKYTTVVDASSWIGVFYNWINNHITKGTVKEECWLRWLDQVQNICKSQGLDNPKTFVGYTKVYCLKRWT